MIGACFSLIAPIEGFTPRATLRESYSTDPAWRRDLAREMARGATAHGSVDYRAVGLCDFGKPDRWIERQVDRWRSQLEDHNDLPNYLGCDLPYVDKVGAWL